MDNKKTMRAEYSALSKLCSAFLDKKSVRVKNVENDELGYTYDGKNKIVELFVAWQHKIYEQLGLTDTEKRFFRKGVCAHELLHQIFTNFSYSEKVVDSRPVEERQLLSQFLNILEDPAIEYFAPTVFGGAFLKSLRFTIAKIYQSSPKVDAKESTGNAYFQYLNAMIQFGDMGVVKGKFTFPEAEEAYRRTLPLFYKGITEPSGKKRIDIGVEIFNSIENLWKPISEDVKAMQELMDMLENMGMTNSSGSGRGSTPNSGGVPSDSRNERRKRTLEKIKNSNSSNEDSSNSSNSSDSPDSPDSSGSSMGNSSDGLSENNAQNTSSGNSSDKEDKNSLKEESASSGCSSNEEPEDESENKKGGSGKESKDEETDEEDNLSNSSDGNNEDDKNSFSNAEDDGDGNFTIESSGEENSSNAEQDNSEKDKNTKNVSYNLPGEGSLEDESFDFSEYELTDDDIAHIKKEIEKELYQDGVLNVEYTGDTTPLLSADGIAYIGKCENVRIKPNVSEEAKEKYAQIVHNQQAEIKRTTKILTEIFASDREKQKFGHSGKVKPKYIANNNGVYTRKGLVTENLFHKKVSPQNVDDIAVAIAVDCSGSMSANLTSNKSRSDCARETCIALAEIFNNLNIPIYIMGFTADRNHQYDTSHFHYITWKNNKADRLSLLDIKPNSCNRDGCSIRYLTKILKQKPAKKKIMFVISDGQPSGSGYYNGVVDTANAIKEAKKIADVVGICIGNNTDEILQNFYQKSYVQVKNNENLFIAITKMLRKLVK